MKKRIAKFLAYGLGRTVLSSWYTTAIFPALAAAYFTFIGGWQDIPFIKSHRAIFFWIFVILLVADLSLRSLKGISDMILASNPVGCAKALIELFKAVTYIIESKTERFRDACRSLSSGSPFDTITRPQDQIKTIMREARSYYSCIGNAADSFDATIMRCLPKSEFEPEKWDFIFQLDSNFSHGSADQLMSVNSTARLAREGGKELFLPSKANAAKVGQYVISERDAKRGGEGSVYCKHIKIDTPRGADEFILTFITYDCTVCDSWDEESCVAWKTVFGEFAKRIELELILHSIKSYTKQLSDEKKEARSQKAKSKKRGGKSS